MKIKFYNNSVAEFVDDLEKLTYAKVLRYIDMLLHLGRNLCMPYSRFLGKGLFELRIRGKQEIRIFYCFGDEEIFLLHGFVKKSQKIPLKELNVALSRLKSLDQ